MWDYNSGTRQLTSWHVPVLQPRCGEHHDSSLVLQNYDALVGQRLRIFVPVHVHVPGTYGRPFLKNVDDMSCIGLLLRVPIVLIGLSSITS